MPGRRDMTISADCTKTQHALEMIRNSISSGSFRIGDRLPSTRSLAARLGMSQIVLRRAFKALEDEGILECRPCSGAYISRIPVAARSIAILSELDISDPATTFFHLRIIEKTRRLLEDSGFRARMHIGRCEQGGQGRTRKPALDELIEENRSQRYSAVVLVTGIVEPRWISKFKSLGIPAVGFSFGRFPFLRSSVSIDQAGMVSDAVLALAARGRRAPAFICWDPSLAAVFRKCARAAGMKFRDDWTYVHRPGTALKGAGYRCFRKIWGPRKCDRPDSAIFADDILFNDARMAIIGSGASIPGELTVAVMHNEGSAVMVPFPAILFSLETDAVAGEFARLAAEIARDPERPGEKSLFRYRLVEHTPQ